MKTASAGWLLLLVFMTTKSRSPAQQQNETHTAYNFNSAASSIAGTGDATKRFESMKVKAEEGDAQAQNELGFCYENGQGITRDAAEAVKWFRKAAEQGYVFA